MIRKIKDLMQFKINWEITSSLKYQELMAFRKLKIEEEEFPEHLLDDSIRDLPTWENIEEDSWNLMQTSGMNWQLFVLWLESNVSSEGFDDFIVVLNFFKDIVLKKEEILKSEDDDSQEKKLLLIEYFDKSIARGLLYSYIKHDYPLSDYIQYKNDGAHDKLFDILNIITEKDYFFYKKIIEDGKNLIGTFEGIFDGFTVHCPKIREVLDKLEDIMNIYEEYFINDQEEEVKEEKKNQDEGVFLSNRDDAYKKISEALEILKKTDSQNLAIPLLRKIMRWNSLNISEILNEINDKDGAHFVVKFLMD